MNAEETAMPAANWIDFSGRICVVTGAAGGMGQEITRSFLDLGARVAALDINGAACTDFVAALGLPDTRVAAFQCDIADPEAVIATEAATRSHFGPADILVNNAAALGKKALHDTSFADWQRVLAVNLSGYFHCAKVYGEQMIQRHAGVIIHIASIAAHEPVNSAGAYSPSKAGVHMMSRQIACEWGPFGIRSNTISPGMIRTPFSEATYQQDGVEAFRKGKIPSRSIGMPRQVADAVMFLASDRASYVNGGDILIDGGLSQTLMAQFPR